MNLKKFTHLLLLNFSLLFTEKQPFAIQMFSMEWIWNCRNASMRLSTMNSMRFVIITKPSNRQQGKLAGLELLLKNFLLKEKFVWKVHLEQSRSNFIFENFLLFFFLTNTFLLINSLWPIYKFFLYLISFNLYLKMLNPVYTL